MIVSASTSRPRSDVGVTAAEVISSSVINNDIVVSTPLEAVCCETLCYHH